MTNDACLFCRIIAHEVEAMIVFEDDISIAFIDHRPLFPGHCLVSPRQHFETLGDLPNELTGQFFRNVQLINRAVEVALGAEGTFVRDE